jgi:hypothetical protein
MQADATARVADFLQEGIQAGGHCVVLATPEHARLLKLRLGGAPGTWRDAAATLSALLINGWPDPSRFSDSVGGLVRSAAAHGPAYVYNEAVMLLCMQGNPKAAVRFDHLWQAMVAALPPDVLLQYPRHVFASQGDGKRFRLASRYVVTVGQKVLAEHPKRQAPLPQSGPAACLICQTFTGDRLEKHKREAGHA